MSKLDNFFESIKNAEASNYSTEPVSKDLYEALTKDHELFLSTHVFPTELVLHFCRLFIDKYAAYSGELIPGAEQDFYSKVPLIIYATNETSPGRSLVWNNGSVIYTDDDHIILTLSKELKTLLEIQEPPADD